MLPITESLLQAGISPIAQVQGVDSEEGGTGEGLSASAAFVRPPIEREGERAAAAPEIQSSHAIAIANEVEKEKGEEGKFTETK